MCEEGTDTSIHKPSASHTELLTEKELIKSMAQEDMLS